MIKLEEYSEVIKKCSHCGYCQAVCPVFKEELLESYTPRGRVNLIKSALLDKSVPVTPRVKEIVDLCLLCTNCSQNCPSQMPADEVITAARIEMAKESRGGTVKKFVMRKVLNQRGLAGVLGKAGSMAQKLNIGPKDVPQLAAKPFDRMYSGTISAEGETRARIGYFVGCGTNFMFPDTGDALVKVMAKNGFEIVIPSGIVCCGIPALSEGDLEGAQDSLRTNMKILSEMQVDAIVTDCTSCGMMLKVKAAKLFPDSDPIQEQIKAVAEKMWEVTDYLNTQGLRAKPGALKQRYTYHVPCHRGWWPTVKDAPRSLLSAVPDSELIEMQDPEACCGAAGTFFMEHRQVAEGIRAPKLKDIEETVADIVVTQCPVCRSYMAGQLKNQKVMHPISMLAKAYGL